MRVLEHTVALVTGSTGAVGSVVARALKDAGAIVVGTHRGGTSSAPPPTVDLTVSCDMTREPDVIACFEQVSTVYGPPDIVVHTVGGFASDGPIEDTSIETWNRMFDMNLNSSFLVVRQSLRTIAPENPKGRIILISAASALKDGGGAVAYRTAKAGLQTIMRIAVAERKGAGPTVNALAPGVIDTHQNRADMPDDDRSSWVSPNEIAAMIVHLCSPAGRSVTGSIIPFS